ncbi:MAG TPA: hypothetical protein VIZ43_25120, partial [Trebonia sp.]
MSDTTTHLQEQVRGAVRKGQELTADAVKKVAETVSAAQAKLPTAEDRLRSLPLADRLRRIPSLPESKAVVSSAFDLLDRVIVEQRKLADDLLKVTAALRSGLEGKPAETKAAGTSPADTGTAGIGAADDGIAGAEPGGEAASAPTAPAESRSARDVPAQAAPAETAPVEPAPTEVAPVEPAPAEPVAVDTAPAEAP